MAGVCMVGVCVAGGHAWQGPCMMGLYVVGGEHAWQGGMHGRVVCGGGQAWWGREEPCMAGETDTAVDGTHPTGMHSCFENVTST